MERASTKYRPMTKERSREGKHVFFGLDQSHKECMSINKRLSRDTEIKQEPLDKAITSPFTGRVADRDDHCLTMPIQD